MTEALAVDTNVIEHISNPTMNVDGHIDSLLRKFSAQRRKLCLDLPPEGGQSRILGEYKHRMEFHTKEERGLVVYWLRYLIVYAERVSTRVDLSDRLGKLISAEMDVVKAERSDQIFVYVASILDSVLISNNAKHITDLRKELKRIARKVKSKNTDFLSSIEAEAAI